MMYRRDKAVMRLLYALARTMAGLLGAALFVLAAWEVSRPLAYMAAAVVLSWWAIRDDLAQVVVVLLTRRVEHGDAEDDR